LAGAPARLSRADRAGERAVGALWGLERGAGASRRVRPGGARVPGAVYAGGARRRAAAAGLGPGGQLPAAPPRRGPLLLVGLPAGLLSPQSRAADRPHLGHAA